MDTTASRPVFRPVPTSAGVMGNGGVRSQRAKSKGKPNHPADPGEGKIGRVTVVEASLCRNAGAMGERRRVGTRTGSDPCHGMRPVSPHARTPGPRSKDGTHPDRSSGVRNVETPMESGTEPVGQLQGRRNAPVGKDDPRSEGQHVKARAQDKGKP